MTPDALKAEIERFLRITGMSATKFGMQAVNDPRFVFDLREGREPRSPTMRRAVEFMSSPLAKPTPSEERAA